MLDAAHWTTRLGELARQARVPGAVLGIWTGEQEILAACGVLNRATRTHDDQPWNPLSFGALADGIPYVCLGGRITPRVE